MKVRVYAMLRNIKRKFKNKNLKTPYRLTKDGIFIRVYFKNYDNKLYEDIICLIYFYPSYMESFCHVYNSC